MEFDMNKYLDFDDMSALFDDFDIITKDEYIMIYENVILKTQVGSVFDILLPQLCGVTDSCAFAEDMPESKREEIMRSFTRYFVFLFVKQPLTVLVYDNNPKKKIFEMLNHICDYSQVDISFINNKEQYDIINRYASLLMYLILYYRFRDESDYIKYILKALASNIRKIPFSKDNIVSFNSMIAALPPHDETEAELKRLENVPEETVKDMYVKAQGEIRQLKKRIDDLEAIISDRENAEAMKENDDGHNDRFYKRKLQVSMLEKFLRCAGVEISNNKTAAAILISNLLHISNYKGVQKMLSENYYLRAADHAVSCAEVNGILEVLETDMRFHVKESKTARDWVYPMKDYSEIIKSYNNHEE